MFICPDQMKPVFSDINGFVPRKEIQVKMRSYSVKCDLYKHYRWGMGDFDGVINDY